MIGDDFHLTVYLLFWFIKSKIIADNTFSLISQFRSFLSSFLDHESTSWPVPRLYSSFNTAAIPVSKASHSKMNYFFKDGNNLTTFRSICLLYFANCFSFTSFQLSIVFVPSKSVQLFRSFCQIINRFFVAIVPKNFSNSFFVFGFFIFKAFTIFPSAFL